VRLGRRADPAWIIAQVALAFPELSIAVLAARKHEATSIAARMRRWMSHDVTKVRSDAIPCDKRRIVVGTYQAILGSCTDIRQRGLLVAIDAVEILGKLGALAINAAENAELLGLLPDH